MSSTFGSVCMFLAVFSVLFLFSGPSKEEETHTKSASEVRNSRYGERKPLVFDKISNRCSFPELEVPKKKVVPAFLASYPGTGTKLQWSLVEATTGVVTTDDQFANGHHNVIAIKTHYPAPAGREFPGAEDILKAIVFVRHPMDVLPAYHDMIYAEENNLNQENPTRAPLQEWINWRDMAFNRELEVWRKHFHYWVERYSALNRLIVPYEDLISRQYGPDLVIQMADFLQRNNEEVFEIIDREDLPCAWQKIVTEVNQDTETSNNRNLRSRRLQQQLQQPQQMMQMQELQNQQEMTTMVMQQQQQEQPAMSVEEMRLAQTGQMLQMGQQLAESGGQGDEREKRTSTKKKSKKKRLYADKDIYRPYTEPQRKEIVIVLAQLLELYGEDRVLAPLLVRYIDEVERRHKERKEEEEEDD